MWCARLALFALALQLYLSFGHIHPEEMGLSAPSKVAEQPAGGNDSPAAPHDDDHGVCSICAALSLTANSVLPVTITLALPVATEWTWPQHVRPPRLVVETITTFRARAPPHA